MAKQTIAFRLTEIINLLSAYRRKVLKPDSFFISEFEAYEYNLGQVIKFLERNPDIEKKKYDFSESELYEKIMTSWS